MKEDWKNKLEDVIREVISVRRLYENAVFLAENKDRNGKVNTYSICLWEKDYPDVSSGVQVPERNYVVANIKDPALKTRPDALKLMTTDLSVGLPEDMEYVDNASSYYILPKDSPQLETYFRALIEKALDIYPGKSDAFGCCSSFAACSEAGKCIHSNQLYAKACSYRKNLESGRIFYGKDPGA